jgi:hypothetical protein
MIRHVFDSLLIFLSQQNAIDEIVLVESVQKRLTVKDTILDYHDNGGTDVVFEVASVQSYFLYENSAFDMLFDRARSQTLQRNIQFGSFVEVQFSFCYSKTCK